jgi:hypothetical protein
VGDVEEQHGAQGILFRLRGQHALGDVAAAAGSAPGYQVAHHCTAMGMTKTATARSQLFVKSGRKFR